MTVRVKSPRALIDCYNLMRANPDEVFTIPVPNDFPERWRWQDFHRWFQKCLDAKINRQDTRTGRYFTDEYQRDQQIDGRTIRDYYQKRIRRPGTQNLRCPEFRRRYPSVNNQRWED